MDVAECDEVSIISGGGDYEDKTIKRSSSKNLNGAMGYLTLEARLAFNKLKKVFTKASIL